MKLVEYNKTKKKYNARPNILEILLKLNIYYF
jgi:hypothetical protein